MPKCYEIQNRVKVSTTTNVLFGTFLLWLALAEVCRFAPARRKRVQNNFLVRYTSSLRCVFTKSWSDPMPPNSTHAGLQTVFKLDP